MTTLESKNSIASPAIALRYARPVSALWIRAALHTSHGGTGWSESAGVRAVSVLGLDGPAASAERALVEFREGASTRQAWVPVCDLARTAKAAAEKLAPYLSALLVAQRPSKMPVTTTINSAA